MSEPAVIDFSVLSPRLRHSVAVEGECWVWTGYKLPTGHGITGKPKVYVYRVAYEYVNGSIPAGLVIHHECHNPPCVRPDHLRAMTHKEHRAHHGLSGAAAVHAAKETCIYGHPFDSHNGIQRVCLTCRRRIGREAWRRNRDRKRAAKELDGDLFNGSLDDLYALNSRG